MDRLRARPGLVAHLPRRLLLKDRAEVTSHCRIVVHNQYPNQAKLLDRILRLVLREKISDSPVHSRLGCPNLGFQSSKPCSGAETVKIAHLHPSRPAMVTADGKEICVPRYHT